MQQCRVCVADDCGDEAAVLCEGLRLNDYAAITAATGEEALRICEQGDIDLLLLDIGLPDIDGYEVLSRLKANPKTADIPVIFVTARGSAEDVAKGYRMGAVDYIAKPYNLPIVMVRVESALRTRQTMRGGSELLDTAYTDELTGLRNRRFLLERLQEEVEKAHRYNYPVSCIVVDVDEITPMDGELGTVSLDDLLVEIALALRHTSRNYDILARFDGAMFAAVLPHTPLGDAISYANKIQEEIGATTFHDPGFPTHAKLNFGIVSCRNGSARGAEHILGEAMRGVLKARSHGREGVYARDLSEAE